MSDRDPETEGRLQELLRDHDWPSSRMYPEGHPATIPFDPADWDGTPQLIGIADGPRVSRRAADKGLRWRQCMSVMSDGLRERIGELLERRHAWRQEARLSGQGGLSADEPLDLLREDRDIYAAMVSELDALLALDLPARWRLELEWERKGLVESVALRDERIRERWAASAETAETAVSPSSPAPTTFGDEQRARPA